MTQLYCKDPEKGVEAREGEPATPLPVTDYPFTPHPWTLSSS